MFPIRSDGSFLAESQRTIGAKIITDEKGFADEVREHATDGIQHVSQWLGYWTIAGMLEITSGVSGADRRKRFSQRLHQSVLGTGPRST